MVFPAPMARRRRRRCCRDLGFGVGRFELAVKYLTRDNKMPGASNQ